MAIKRKPLVDPELTAKVKALVEKSVPKVWQQICYDVDQLEGGATLEDAVEMCLDAHRPVEMGGLTKEECELIYKYPGSKTVDQWAREVLRGYF